jgi:hypothetical protein
MSVDFYPQGVPAMKRFLIPSRRITSIVVLVAFMAHLATPAFAKSPVKMKKFQGAIDLSAEGPLPFVLEGTASHLGVFEAEGEVEFFPGEEQGTLIGQGVVVFEAANGDLLVGAVTWKWTRRLTASPRRPSISRGAIR